MNRQSFRIIFNTLLLLGGYFHSALIAQEFDTAYVVEHYSIEQGLPNRVVNQVEADNKGFIWLGMRGAISRFDGVRFLTYTHADLGCPNCFLDIINFAIDYKGRLWIYTYSDNKFLKILNPESDSIVDFDTQFAGIAPFRLADIFKIYKDRGNPNILLFSLYSNRLFRYDGNMTEVKLPGGVNVLDEHFQFSSMSKIILWRTGNTLIETDLQSNILSKVENSSYTGKMFDAAAGAFYLAGANYPHYFPINEQYLFRKKPNKDLEKIPLYTKNETSLPKNIFISYLDSLGNGIGFLNQFLYRFDSTGNVFQTIDISKEINFNVKNPNISDVYYQKNTNLIWVCTSEGFFKIRFFKKKFNKILKGNSIRGIIDVGDSLLINTYNGSFFYDVSQKKISKWDKLKDHGLGMTRTPDAKLFIGHDGGGLRRIDLKTGEENLYWLNPLRVNGVHLPHFDAKTGKIWVATTVGLNYVKLDSKHLIPFEKDSALQASHIYQFYRNQSGLWLAANSGLYLLDANEEVILHLGNNPDIPIGHIRYIHEDADGVFWIATIGNGIVRWEGSNRLSVTPKPEDFRVFNQQTAGFSNNNIYSIHEDKYGFLWLPSDNGLMRFDKKSNTLNIYQVNDGLPHEEFNFLANFEAPDGRLFLGGLNGVVIFDPKDFLVPTQNHHPLHIVDFLVWNDKTDKLENRNLILRSQKGIFLNASDRFFELKFALLDFTSPAQNRYSYFIEGFEKDWNVLNDKSVRISGLPPGKYTLRVRAQGSDGSWSTAEISLPIVVHAPLYKRWEFWMLLSALFLITSWLIYRWRTQKLLDDRDNLEIEVAQRTATIAEQATALQKLDKAKTRFFTNLTHEFRTPLTLILAPLESILRQKESSPFADELSMVQRNAQKLLHLVNQLLDISKLEAGELKSVPIPGEAVQFSRSIFERFLVATREKRLHLTFEANVSEFQATLDYALIEIVLSNLLSNAIKYTKEGGSIVLCLHVGSTILWTVRDSGKGIAAEDLPHVFNRFYRGQEAETSETEGTGIGLALAKEISEFLNAQLQVKSSIGIGTIFEFSVPLPQEELMPHMEGLLPERNPDEITESLNTPSISINPENGPKLEILIAEDNPEMQQVLTLALQEKYFLRIGSNGIDALKIAAETVPDLVISDVMMPEMDGLSLVRALRADIRCSHIPVILLTAKSGQENKIAGLETGANAYLTKPFSQVELELIVQNLLEIRQKMQLNQQEPRRDIPKFSMMDQRFLEELNSIVFENMAEGELSGEFLGKKMHMSRMTLHRKLKALTGQSAGEFIKNIRLERSHELLETSGMNVTEVAYTCGFGSLTHFSTAFREKYGVPPSELLK